MSSSAESPIAAANRSGAGSIEGQLNARERELLTGAILSPTRKPAVAIEVGTWLGGGSTLHILRAMEKNGLGHLWGVEADPSIYDRMLANLRSAAPEALHRFTPLFGFSQNVIPKWLAEQKPGFQVDFAFLDGGNNPLEQMVEFRLLEDRIPVGGQVMAHDVKLRKGKWFAPYISRLDNWRTTIHDVSEEGLLHAVKVGARPSSASRRAAGNGLLVARLHPVELAATFVPRRICGWVLRLLPTKTSRLLSDGRKAA